MKKREIKRIGIRIPNWIGDAIMSTPLLNCIQKNFPDIQLYLIMRKAVQSVFTHTSYKTIIIDDKKTGLIRTGKNLRQYNLDLFLNIPESFSSAVITFFSKAGIKAGYPGETKGLFLNFTIKDPKRSIHRAEKYFNLFKETILSKTVIPFPFEYTKIEDQFCSLIKITPSEKKRAKEILKKYKVKNKLIGINPNCSAESRRWLKDRFAGLADTLYEKQDCSILFFGSFSEKKYVQSITQTMKHQPTNLAGKLNLREYIAILSELKIFITNDSGPMHLANAVNTDVIALEGPADIKETGMLNKTPQRIYINGDVDCSPCVKNKCPKNDECMKAISIKDVLNKVDKLLI